LVIIFLESLVCLRAKFEGSEKIPPIRVSVKGKNCVLGWISSSPNEGNVRQALPDANLYLRL